MHTADLTCPTTDWLTHSLTTCLGHERLLVEVCEDPRGLTSLDQVAHRLVVKVVDLLPRDALLGVLLLLRLEGAVDKELLQLLVAIVDAQLLEQGMARLGQGSNRMARLGIGQGSLTTRQGAARGGQGRPGAAKVARRAHVARVARVAGGRQAGWQEDGRPGGRRTAGGAAGCGAACLLEGVDLEDLEAVDVEHAQGEPLALRRADGRVDLHDERYEEACVQRLGKRLRGLGARS